FLEIIYFSRSLQRISRQDVNVLVTAILRHFRHLLNIGEGTHEVLNVLIAYPCCRHQRPYLSAIQPPPTAELCKWENRFSLPAPSKSCEPEKGDL
ncbi:unnamed protein product, partial [Porites lobata]